MRVWVWLGVCERVPESDGVWEGVCVSDDDWVDVPDWLAESVEVCVSLGVPVTDWLAVELTVRLSVTLAD